MRKVNKLAALMLLSLSGGALVASPVAFAAAKGECPIDKRKSQAVGQSSAKKVQRSFQAYQDGNLDEAIAILLEANPSDSFDKAYVARMLGNFYAEKGQMDTALKYLKQAVDANVLGGADHGQTMRLYADILVGEKQFKGAIEYYYKWMEFTCKTEDSQVYRRIAVSHSQLKEWDKTLATADKAIQYADKPDKGLYQLKLTSYYEKKQYKNAIGVLETMVKLFPADKSLWVQLAQFYLLVEDYNNAAVTYDLAYKMGALTTEANLKRLPQLLAQQGAPYQAAKVFEKHLKAGDIKKDKANVEQLARFYHQAKELKVAASYYGEAATFDNDGDMYLKQGRLYSIERDYKPAIEAFKKALDSGVKNQGEVDFELGLAYIGLKQYKSAYTYMQRAANDSKTARNAKSYISYIKEKARINNVTL
ncbi:tetratricopeptide repeat protein [Shewanella sp. GXUN23E]|uniref:tetratricopeptide repeat protein n=1 Tax=Shewanella sp. GXUN23E TaxID=3422498 RepID=UPI003D7DD53C